MQSVAMEMNQAETAFFWPQGNDFGLRWFTPAVEVDLCGHATLASAHVLFAESPNLRPAEAPDQISFFTKSGTLVCRRAEGGIAMDFPSDPPQPVEPPPGIAQALGAEPVWGGQGKFDWYFEVASQDELVSLAPDLARIKALGKRGVCVTAAATPSDHRDATDFVSRFFAPQSGIDEDPVTGSAHCALGPYWAQKLGRATVTGYQASKRGGTVRIEVNGDRVALLGSAVTVLEGALRS